MNSSKTLQKRPARRRIFTPEQANATLPLVRAIVSDLVGLSRDVADRRQRLALLLAGKAKADRDPYHEELVQIQREMDKDMQQLKEYIEELRALGVEPKSGGEGLVDFPAVLDGRKVYLCWKLGESQVLFLARPGGRLRRPAVPPSRLRVPIARRRRKPAYPWQRQPELGLFVPARAAQTGVPFPGFVPLFARLQNRSCCHRMGVFANPNGRNKPDCPCPRLQSPPTLSFSARWG